MNELLGICESLEGFSSDIIGFSVLEAEKCNDTWKLIVERYSKGLESPTEKYNNTLIVLAERLYNKYSSNRKHYDIITCSKFICKDKWCIIIQELKEVEDEKITCEEGK